jgi:hypothetical protein
VVIKEAGSSKTDRMDTFFVLLLPGVPVRAEERKSYTTDGGPKSRRDCKAQFVEIQERKDVSRLALETSYIVEMFTRPRSSEAPICKLRSM